VIKDLTVQSATPTRSAVLTAYQSVSWRGIANHIVFNRHHELKAPRIYLYRVHGRQIRFVRGLSA
jgi:hypothetical protein